MNRRLSSNFLTMFEPGRLGGEGNSQLLRLARGFLPSRRSLQRKYHPGPLQSLRLLAEDAQLETKRSNEGDTSQSETSE
jgi:hypothetical protein